MRPVPPLQEPPPPASRPAAGWEVAIGPGVERAATARAYVRGEHDPPHRPLRIYTLDPTASVLEGCVAQVNVPFEPLRPGPRSAVFEVLGDGYRSVDLDEPALLLRAGRDPSPSDPRFAQQMVYAVCALVYHAFRQALGRHLAWGFEREPDADGAARLRLRPHGCEARNAFYDKQRGELCFGYYRADEQVHGRSLPGGYVFTCLAHDIIAHEATHALLDGLRAHFTHPSGPDVLAFHEGFADLVAVLQRFGHRAVVEAGLRAARGRPDRAELLTGLARQFGQTTGAPGALRSAIALDADGRIAALPYDAGAEPHVLGSVLVSAAFEAFCTVFTRKTERYVRLATGGSGVLPPGEIPADLRTLLADEAGKLAQRFLALCIRAIDYSPPVDLELGEYLRAVVTADHDLVPDDRWGYREAWIEAFARRGIYPRNVRSLAEDALRWQPPQRPLLPVRELSFAELKFDGDPGNPANADELRRQAQVLGRVVRLSPEQFGLADADAPELRGDAVDAPVIQSVRSSRRAGPDGQVVFDLVAEVTQRRHVRHRGEEFDLFGGATVILGPRGEVRYVIAKNVLNEERLERSHAFIRGVGRERYWTRLPGGHWQPAPQLFRMLHDGGAAG